MRLSLALLLLSGTLELASRPISAQNSRPMGKPAAPVGEGIAQLDLGAAPPPADSFFTQQGYKLVGTGSINSRYGVLQGKSVSLSGDGNTAIVGGDWDNSTVGAAWVFVRRNGVWSQQGGKLIGSDASSPAWQGWSVALSSDGTTAVVGGVNDYHNTNNSENTGSVWVFTRTDSTWEQQGSRLYDSTARSFESVWQGSSVAISSDGNTMLVGGQNDSNDVGAAWVYTRSGGVWTQQGAKLVGTGWVGSPHQGYSVALSADGNTALVSGALDNSETGATWVFTRSGGVWSQQGDKLVGTGGAGASSQGISVAISSDGNTALVGGYGDSSFTGAAWVFTRSNGVWSQQGNKLVGTGAVGSDVEQGSSVALSGDGNTAVIGGPADSNSVGAAWVFTRSNGIWTQLGGKLVGAGAAGLAHQGTSVAISSDGNTAIVGGDDDSLGIGAAWIFVRQQALPIQLASFTAQLQPNGQGVLLNWTTLSEFDNFGFDVQRSLHDESHYETLPNSFVPGHGTTVEPHQYSFIDSTATADRWYYRLRQTNLDGSIRFSDGILINTLTEVPPHRFPEGFSLDQNYPDPFNPTTTIQYRLPSASHVTLKVYAATGQLVSTLVDGVQAAGTHSATWDAQNFASGVYLCRMVAVSGPRTFSRGYSMVLLK